MQSLLNSKSCKVDAFDSQGYSPVALAAQEGHVDMIRLLHYHGAMVDKPCKNGTLPLVLAAKTGNIEAVHLLR